MSVRAKFYVTEVRPNGATDENEGFTVTLFPVMNGSAENKEFYKWTPGGSISLSTINKAAAEQFVPGKEYYVDFNLAE